MKVADNSGLQVLSNIIIESINTSGIYCFGEKRQSRTVQNPFQTTTPSGEEHTHFYLLVLVNEYVINAVANISDIIKTKTEGRYTATLLIHKTKSIRFYTPHKIYFFHQVMTKGVVVYEHPIMPPNIAFDELPKRETTLIRSYWNNRNNIADVFLGIENQVDGMDTEVIQEVMLHIAVEQTCLGLIDTFLGYRPNHFSLVYLFELCEVFCPIPSEIFPRITAEDKKLFDLLNAPTSSLRWAELKTTSFLNTGILERRCNLFMEKAFELAESELKRLEGLEGLTL